MRQYYFSIILLFTVLITFGQSTEVGVTNGELSVSLTGAANYNIPISVPPGINEVIPKLSLVYSSQSGNGMAGYGWNIGGISAITRIQPSALHDGIINPVDGGETDRFALDGQRLVKKDGGKYFDMVGPGRGNAYELENFSNIQVKSYNQTGNPYSAVEFGVTYPDGSYAYYKIPSGQTTNEVYLITYWQNAQGVRINYNYNSSANKKSTLASVTYGSVTTGSPLNEIKFIYKSRSRAEQGYSLGYSMTDDKLLSEIQVLGSGTGFRNYVLAHDKTTLGYDRLISITEKSGDNTKSYSPTIFDYEKSVDAVEAKPNTASIGMSNINSDSAATISGDYDGDGKMDFIVYPTQGDDQQKKFWLFTDIKNSDRNIPQEIAPGYFIKLFPSSFIFDGGQASTSQGIVALQQVDQQNVKFTTYYNSIYGMGPLRSRPAAFPARMIKSCSSLSTIPPFYLNITSLKSYYSGDFNGDGITDVIAIDNEYIPNTTCSTGNEPAALSTGKVYFVDLDSRKTSNYIIEAGTFVDYFKNFPNQITYVDNDRIETFDVNGDGKTDILHFKRGKLTVYNLDSNNQLKILSTTVDSNIQTRQNIIPGDYNGDGRMDFLVSLNTGLTNSNDYFKFLSTGTSFEKTSQYYPFPNVGSGVITESGGGVSVNNLIPLDYNGDGKTDMVHFRTIYGNAAQQGAIIINSYNNTGSGFGIPYKVSVGPTTAIKSYAAPIFLTPNKNNQYIGVGAISDNLIYTFNSQKNTGKETSLILITNGNGVKESITYSELKQDQYKTIYTPSLLTEKYPNTDLQASPGFKIVTMLEMTSATEYKKQLFNYYGAVSNSYGLGFLGFRATARTNWYNDDSKMLSYISKNDINLRGANTENYTVLGFAPANYMPATFITKTVFGLNTATDALQTNKVFKLKNTSIKEYNGLDGTSIETALQLDAYNQPTTSIRETKEGATVIETAKIITTYKDPKVAPYIFGLPVNKTQSISITGSLVSTEEIYDYTTTGLLKEIKKKATGMSDIIENNEFDDFGNVTKKTITAGSLTPRITSYVYDTTGRFLLESTGISLLTKKFTYNQSSGLLTSETNENGLKTTYDYDSWFKKTITTDYLGKTSTASYTKSAEKTVVTTVSSDGNASEETFDDLGRKIKAGVKNVSGNYSYVSYLYDTEDRNTKISEPHTSASPSLWNETQYDAYGRVTKNLYATGRSITTTYPSGLTTKIDEGSKSKIVTRNALGNITAVEDTPGGKITYSYYADGNLKETVFGTAKTSIKVDGWGRKTEINDPSAGVFTYAYNDFNETTKVTTPNGYISYKINNIGQREERSVNTATEGLSKTTYTYDPTSKLLSKSTFQDLKNGTSITNTYRYDAKYRLDKTVETTAYATFTKEYTFDAYGRTSTETFSAISSGKKSDKIITNSYLNGSLYQKLDAGTVLWETSAVDAKGQITKAINGPLTITNKYDTYGLPEEFKFDKTTGGINILTLGTTFDAVKGNLKKRTNSLFSWSEDFQYDALDRLTSFKNAAGVLENQSYDDSGRISQNGVGSYTYSATKPYQNSSIETTTAGLTYYSGRKVPTITYNPFKAPIEIIEDTVDKVSFTYNDSDERSVMFYGGLQNDPLARQFRKHYSSDGSMEIKENRLTNTFEFLTYIGGNAYSAPIVFKTDGGSTQKYLYLLRDYQQSIIAIADASGTLLEKRLFDAWGDILKAQDGNGNALVGLNVLDRGYTGHEHLVSVRLIHMNGRLYDPKLHRFLQPDNYVQDAFNTQNYNRYGYCWNNPFRYTDPSGEWIHVAAGAVIGGLVNWGMHGFQLNSKGLMAFGIGAAGGAMMACGNVAGLTFFQAGIVTAGFAVVGTMFTGVANHAAFGDPLPTMRQMAITAVISFATGGIFRAPKVPVSEVSELTPAAIVTVKAESSIVSTTTSTTIQNTASQATAEASDEVVKAGLNFKSWTNAEGQLQFSANAIAEPLQDVVVKSGGRLGNEATRQQIAKIATELETRGYKIIGGGGKRAEEYLKPLNPGRKGGSFLDITAKHPEYGTLRINTVDMMKDGINATERELLNAARIRTQIAPGQHLLLIPKM